MIKNNFRILKKPHANLQTIAKAPVKFQKDWPKTVGGVEGTRYLLKIRNHAPRTTHYGKPKTMSLRFSSKRRGTMNKKLNNDNNNLYLERVAHLGFFFLITWFRDFLREKNERKKRLSIWIIIFLFIFFNLQNNWVRGRKKTKSPRGNRRVFY